MILARWMVLIGDKTRQAIRQEQNRLGLSPTGRAGQQILKAFRRGKCQVDDALTLTAKNRWDR